MGCSSAKYASDSEQSVPEVRRRLSLGHIGPPGKSDSEDHLENLLEKEKKEDRSLLLSLSKEQVLDMIENGEQIGRRFSIGSNTDKAMEKVPSFRSKTVHLTGQQFDMSKDMIGYSCRKGLKPESPNQDSFFILKVEQEYGIYGVFDGHGRKGHDISNFVKDLLPKLLLTDPNLSTDPLLALGNAFEQTQRLIVQATELKKIDALRSGTTCSVIFNDHRTNMLHVAHVGDSRCVLGRIASEQQLQPSSPSASGDDMTPPNPGEAEGPVRVKIQDRIWEAVDLTIDHKPDLPEEKARIEAAGGRVIYDGGWNYRVYAKGHKGPGLNMSRAMGDLMGYYHAGISASPDVVSHAITAESTLSTGSPSTDFNHFANQDVMPEGPGCTSPTKAKGGAKESNLLITNQDSLKTQMNGTESVSSKPSLASYELKPTDKFVLLCSDGVWEFISSEEAVSLIGSFDRCDAMKAAERLASVSWERWMRHMQGQVVDDITAVLVNLSPGINAAPSGPDSCGGVGALSPSSASPRESFTPQWSRTNSCHTKLEAVGEPPVSEDGRPRSAQGDQQTPEEEHNTLSARLVM